MSFNSVLARSCVWHQDVLAQTSYASWCQEDSSETLAFDNLHLTYVISRYAQCITCEAMQVALYWQVTLHK